MSKQTKDLFLSGVFSSMQFLVLVRDEPQLAKELAKAHGMSQSWALAESKRTGWSVRAMNKFIREELRPSAALAQAKGET